MSHQWCCPDTTKRWWAYWNANGSEAHRRSIRDRCGAGQGGIDRVAIEVLLAVRPGAVRAALFVIVGIAVVPDIVWAMQPTPQDSVELVARSLLSPFRTHWLGVVVSSIAVATVVWVIANPFAAAKLWWQIVSLLFDRFTKRFAKASTEEAVNKFLSRKLFPGSTDAPVASIRVEFVTKPTVRKVTDDALHFELEPGVFGRVPAHRVREAGFELADYESTVIAGAQYDVVVEGAKERRKEFRLRLARND